MPASANPSFLGRVIGNSHPAGSTPIPEKTMITATVGIVEPAPAAQIAEAFFIDDAHSVLYPRGNPA
jgi:hypothetical protein